MDQLGRRRRKAGTHQHQGDKVVEGDRQVEMGKEKKHLETPCCVRCPRWAPGKAATQREMGSPNLE